MKLNLALAITLAVALFASLFVGHQWIGIDHWLAGDLKSAIVIELRLPRACAGALIGAALGMAGAAMQGYLRNPLADPGLFGISATAALGAVASLFFGFAARAWLLPLFALGGAAAGMALLALIVGRSGSVILFTLAGVILSSLAGSATTLLISLAPTPFASSEIITWLIGALTDRSWDDVRIAAPPIAIGMLLMLRAGASLNALTLGEPAARSLGVDMARLQALIVAGVGLSVGASVAIAGVIGFVGLVVPHLVRPFTSQAPAALLVPSALAGAVLVLIADMIVRILPLAGEMRLGVALSMLGAPFFAVLLYRLRRELA